MNPLSAILAAFTAIATAGARYLEWKIATAPADRIAAAHHEADDIEDEIDRLRDLGTPAATARADRLRQRYARKRGYAETLSTLDPATLPRAGDPDPRRPAPPPSP